LTGPIFVETLTQTFYSAGTFVSQNYGYWDGEFALPEMDVCSADACHLDSSQGFSGCQGIVYFVFTKFEGLLEGCEDRDF